MSLSKRRWLAAAVGAMVVAGFQSTVIPARADPEPPSPAPPPPSTGEVLHNITYRARATGTSRGATVSYKIDDNNVNSDQPTLLPGFTFEVNTVLTDPAKAGMEISIEWPYGSNLHCEILVDDQIVVQADQFIAPRLFHPRDDPLYGTLQCGAPLSIPAPVEAPPADAPAPAV